MPLQLAGPHAHAAAPAREAACAGQTPPTRAAHPRWDVGKRTCARKKHGACPVHTPRIIRRRPYKSSPAVRIAYGGRMNLESFLLAGCLRVAAWNVLGRNADHLHTRASSEVHRFDHVGVFHLRIA